MIAKEKALELFQKHAKQWHISPKEVKEDTIITVDEIIDVLGGAGVYSFADPKTYEYWEEVKLEIEKL